MSVAYLYEEVTRAVTPEKVQAGSGLVPVSVSVTGCRVAVEFQSALSDDEKISLDNFMEAGEAVFDCVDENFSTNTICYCTSADGKKWRMSINNDGAIVTEEVSVA